MSNVSKPQDGDGHGNGFHGGGRTSIDRIKAGGGPGGNDAVPDDMWGRRIAPWNQGAYNVYLARTNADEGASDHWQAILSEGVRTFSAVGPSRSAALRSLAAMVEFAEAAP